MTLSTPYLFYILGAYGLTLFSLGAFLGWSYVQWKKSTSLSGNVSRET
jgi:heme exporter protein CcmD